MQRAHNEYELDDNPERIDFERVHGWLQTTCGSPGIEREQVEKAARGSALLVGTYRDGKQVGYLRVISDKTTFAWICDIFVDEGHQGSGIGKAMVQFALGHPDYQELHRWLLATRDAQGVYHAVGFNILPNPEQWMIFLPDKSPEPRACEQP
jgi:GNAT superfamily N-acetyltransferase